MDRPPITSPIPPLGWPTAVGLVTLVLVALVSLATHSAGISSTHIAMQRASRQPNPVFTIVDESMGDGEVIKFFVVRGGRRITAQEFYSALQTVDQLGHAMTAALRDSGFDAFFWETPAVDRAHMADQPFEFVLVDAPRLAGVRGDGGAFSEHLAKCKPEDGASITTFTNLGGDSTLCSPCKLAAASDNVYAHFASFLRGAPDRQIAEMWVRVGEAFDRWTATSEAAVWVSTSGYVILTPVLDPCCWGT